jgi:hypothetical protein
MNWRPHFCFSSENKDVESQLAGLLACLLVRGLPVEITVALGIGSKFLDLQLRGQLPIGRNSLLSLIAALKQLMAPKLQR